MRLSDLFIELSPWIKELDEKAPYNDPIKVDDYYYYIYCWVNLDTQWCYVGFHKSMDPYNTECYMGSCGNPHYWRSMNHHEYKCIILQYTTSIQSLYTIESYYLTPEYVRSYSNKGIFNLVSGGKGGFDYINSNPELTKKAMITKLARLNGNPLFINGMPKSAIHRSLEVRLSDPDKYINGMPKKIIAASHTPVANKRRTDSDKRNHGGKQGWNQPQVYETQKIKYGGQLAMNTPESIKIRGPRMRVSLLFNTIRRVVDYLIATNQDLNIDNYKINCPVGHLDKVKELIDLIKSDQRYLPEYDLIFSNIDE